MCIKKPTKTQTLNKLVKPKIEIIESMICILLLSIKTGGVVNRF